MDTGAVMEREWQALLGAHPSLFDDVPPPPDVWNEDPPPPLTTQLAALSEQVAAVTVQLLEQVAVAGDAELMGWLLRLSEVVDRLPAADQILLAELDRRDTAERYGCATTGRLLTTQAQVRPGIAQARVRAARSMGPRRSVTGEPLPPLREHIAAAQAAGAISADHAAVIDRGLAVLPSSVSPAEVARLERTLVELAQDVEPGQVAVAARFARELLDPDGREPRDDLIERQRGLVIRPGDDGMGRITGDLTPELLAQLQAVLSPLAAPRPADDMGADARTAPQRTHDALADLCGRFLQSGTLPDSGGTPACVVVSLTLEELEARAGLAFTQFGGTMTIDRLLKFAGECEYIPVVLGNGGGVLAYGRTPRTATAGQTKALIARDKGCTVPGCGTPADWCQRHHIVAHADGGPTSLSNLTLLCKYHHRMFEKLGWECLMVDGRPYWRPPAHLDPDRIPLRNTHWDVYRSSRVRAGPEPEKLGTDSWESPW